MADTDPENEVGDVPGPADGPVVAPHADAGPDEERQHEPQESCDGGRHAEGDPILSRCLENVALDDGADFFREVVIMLYARKEGRIDLHQSRILLDYHTHACSSGLGLRSLAR